MSYLPKVPDTAGWVPKDWQKDMQKAFRRLEPLLDFLHLNPKDAPYALALDTAFPILVSESFASAMRKGDWLDPLLLQIVPLAAEKNSSAGFNDDAVGDLPAQIIPGLLHKYASRALLMVSPHCAIHCRYCFRREFPYADLPHSQKAWEPAWEYLRRDKSINEIVFSGGDPLFLDNRQVQSLLDTAMAIPNIQTLRFHTRLPIVLPSRMDVQLLELFKAAASVKSLIIVIHANHANEINTQVARALGELRSNGALLLNQTVLLKGVNDHADTLIALSHRLIQQGVLPYYLHQLDRVTGTAHFEVAEKRGLEIIEEMRAKLPGYLIPKYVREEAGQAYKSPLY